MTRRPLSFALRIALIVLGAAASAYTAAGMWKRFDQSPAIDFYLVWLNGQPQARELTDNIYGPEAQIELGHAFYARGVAENQPHHVEVATVRRSLDSRGSPLLYTAFRGLSDLYDTAIHQYRALLIFSFGVGMILFGVAGRVPFPLTLLLIALSFRYSLPVRADFDVANVNAIQLAALGIFVFTNGRFPVASNALLAMLVAMKPNLVLVAALLYAARVVTARWARLWREVAGAALGSMIAIAIGSIGFGTPKIWLQWFASAGGLYGMLMERINNNVAPALGLFERYGAWPSYVLAGVLVLLVLIAVRRAPSAADDAMLVGLGLIIYFLSATLVWLHYLVLAIPLGMVLMRNRWLMIPSLAALVVLASEVQTRFFGTATPDLRQPWITAALAGLYVMALWTLFRARREDLTGGTEYPAAPSRS